MVLFLKESGGDPNSNSQICHIDVNWWLLLSELVILLKVSRVGPITNSHICQIYLTGDYLSSNWWYFWRCPELSRLPTHIFVTFKVGDYLPLNRWYFWSWPYYQLTNFSHWSSLVITCHWIGDIFDGVRSWPNYQLTHMSFWCWLVSTCHWIGDIFLDIQGWPDY